MNFESVFTSSEKKKVFIEFVSKSVLLIKDVEYVRENHALLLKGTYNVIRVVCKNGKSYVFPSEDIKNLNVVTDIWLFRKGEDD